MQMPKITDDATRMNPMLAGAVKRWHTWPTLREQTVADHTFNALRIYMAMFGITTDPIVQAIMEHDLGEMTVGDIPYPAKILDPEFGALADAMEKDAIELLLQRKSPTLTEMQRMQIRMCDILEGLEFSYLELMMGNSYAIVPIDRSIAAANTLFTKLRWANGTPEQRNTVREQVRVYVTKMMRLYPSAAHPGITEHFNFN